ncbi:MAG TPA: YraN family protein [Nocardioidaceae bacterium]|jgi:putative endonuclease|nr:YraN family protein [Nocardioidaceae bacterium]
MASTADGRRALGQWGEDLAARCLVEAGLVVLDRNWRCDLGELDIVARSGDVLVVVEVKTRTTDLFGPPMAAVTRPKASRLRRLTARWLAEHTVSPREVRIDVVSIFVPHSGVPEIEHLQAVA